MRGMADYLKKRDLGRFDIDDLDQLVVDTRSLGQTGLYRAAGIISEESLPQLDGQRGMRIFRDMIDNDPICNAMVFVITQLVRTVDWRVKPASVAWYDQQAAEHVDSCLHDMEYTWVDHICEMISMIWYGFSVHELVMKWRCGDDPRKTHRSKYRDGRVGWRYLPIRSQDSIIRWHFDFNGDILGFEQQSPPDFNFVSIPIEKCLHFRTVNFKNNPAGRSVLRGAYEPWYFKRAIQRIEAIGIERDLAGLPVIRCPPDMLDPEADDDKRALKSYLINILKNIRNDEQAAILLPLAYDENNNPMFEFELASTGGSRQFDTDKIIQRYDHRISIAALADFLLLGASGSSATGSWAMHADKTRLFVKSVGAFLDVICAEFNRKAIPDLMRKNCFRMSDYPKLEHGGLEKIDTKEMGEFLRNLATTGLTMFPNQELEKAIFKAVGLPGPVDINDLGNDADVQPEPQATPKKIVSLNPPEELESPEPSSAPRPQATNPNARHAGTALQPVQATQPEPVQRNSLNR